MTVEFQVKGRVVERESGRPIADVRVRAYDKDLLFDDVLGDATTNDRGEFSLSYSKKDFSELFEAHPDLYFKIFQQGGHNAFHSTADSVKWNASKQETVQIDIPAHKLPPKEGLSVDFVDNQGRRVEALEAGETMLVQLEGLTPNRTHRFKLIDTKTSKEVLSVSLVSNRFGVIAPTVLWPDVGIGVPEAGGAYAFESHTEARHALGGRTFALEVNEGDKTVRRGAIRLTANAEARRLLPVNTKGSLQRGLLLGKDELRVRGENFPAGALVDVYLVARKVGWRTGDTFEPARNTWGKELAQTVTLKANQTEFDLVLAPPDELLAGSYDLIARVTQRGEYGRAERVIRDTDFISERFTTTLVVRDDIFRYKPIHMGCVMAMHEIAGKMLWGVPEEILYTNNFPKGTDVWAALDPAGLMPDALGKKIRYYVVQHKTAAQWGSDSSLSDVTGTTTEVITSPSCVNANAALVWSNPMTPGRYDLVVDFGNNDPNPTGYVSDSSFDPPLDMIDGYLNVGFYVTDDPSVAGSFAVGSTSYSDPAVTIPAVGVWHPTYGTYGDTPSGTLSLPMNAVVRYPADVAGANVPVSAAQANYPLVVIMHGMHTTADPSYLGYNYLLDHLASHGFIAVSIDCNAVNAIQGMQDTRAHAILEHLALLNAKNATPGLFQSKIDMTRIGIMGHSRGGDGVVQAEVLNQSLGLGWNIQAVVSLAPTDFSGTSPSPLALNTSKFLCLYGANDGDVWGGTNPGTQYTGTGFRFYDRATVEKSMIFMYGATHNRFNTEWGTEGKVDTTSAKVLSTSQHHHLLNGYMTAFMQVHLQNRGEQLAYFTGELKIPQVSIVNVHAQYLPQSRLELDHFETAPAIGQNSLGGTVTHANLDGAPQEGQLTSIDGFSPHQTRGLRVRWNSTTAVYESEIPVGGQRDVTSWEHLSFRVTQKVGSASNPANQKRDFRVRLTTAGGGNSRAVRAGYFGEIPPPYHPEYTALYNGSEGPNTKSAMKTVRIPLYAWTIKCLSVPQVDLSNVESVTFEFDYDPTGELEIDNIAFSA